MPSRRAVFAAAAAAMPCARRLRLAGLALIVCAAISCSIVLAASGPIDCRGGSIRAARLGLKRDRVTLPYDPRTRGARVGSASLRS